MSYSIESGNEYHSNLTASEMKLKEALYRGLRKDYIVTCPDGYRIICEVVK